MKTRWQGRGQRRVVRGKRSSRKMVRIEGVEFLGLLGKLGRLGERKVPLNRGRYQYQETSSSRKQAETHVDWLRSSGWRAKVVSRGSFPFRRYDTYLIPRANR